MSSQELPVRFWKLFCSWELRRLPRILPHNSALLDPTTDVVEILPAPFLPRAQDINRSHEFREQHEPRTN
jgi:hypothetical protein